MQENISGVDASWQSFVKATDGPIFAGQALSADSISNELRGVFDRLPEGQVLLMRWGINTLFRDDHHNHDYLFRWKMHDNQPVYMVARYDDERRLAGTYFGKDEALGFTCTSLPQEIDGIVDGMIGDIGSMVSWRHASPYGTGFVPALTYWQIDPETGRKQKHGTADQYAIPVVDAAITAVRPAMELFAGVRYRDVERVQRAMNNYGADVNMVDSGALMTPLIYSVYQDAPGITKKLLDLGASPNMAPSEQGFTALMIAAHNGKMAICNQLLAHPDIDIGQTCLNGRTAVDYAQDYRLKRTIRLAQDRQDAEKLLQMPPEMWQQYRNQGHEYRRKFMP